MADLATEAERRIMRMEGMSNVIIEEMRCVEPGLSATEVPVAVSVQTAEDIGDPAVTAQFAEVVGIEGPDDVPP